MGWISWTKAAWFAGGIAAAGAATLASKSPSVHKAAVNVVAKGLAVNDCIQNATQTIMDDADDLRAEAKRKAKIDAAVAEHLAAIENDIREEVEASVDAAAVAEPAQA